MLDLKQECYLKCIPDYMALFRSAGGLQLFWDPTALLPFFREVLYPRISPPGHTYNRCYFLGNFLMELFCPFWYLGNVFLPIAFSGFQKKGPPTQAKRAHRNTRKGKDIKRSNKRFLYCGGVKKEEIYKVNQSRFINFLALKGSYSRRNIGFTAKSSSSKKALWFMSAKSLYHTQGNFIFFSMLYSTESIKN